MHLFETEWLMVIVVVLGHTFAKYRNVTTPVTILYIYIYSYILDISVKTVKVRIIDTATVAVKRVRAINITES